MIIIQIDISGRRQSRENDAFSGDVKILGLSKLPEGGMAPKNWAFKLDQFCSNWITFRNGVWVRAEERARMNTNGPILWRIVCRVCRWSFFKF